MQLHHRRFLHGDPGHFIQLFDPVLLTKHSSSLNVAADCSGVVLVVVVVVEPSDTVAACCNIISSSSSFVILLSTVVPRKARQADDSYCRIVESTSYFGHEYYYARSSSWSDSNKNLPASRIWIRAIVAHPRLRLESSAHRESALFPSPSSPSGDSDPCAIASAVCTASLAGALLWIVLSLIIKEIPNHYIVGRGGKAIRLLVRRAPHSLLIHPRYYMGTTSGE